jgi:succinate-semialdehyde dehydrogenase/glutarate-semialdehyde dehydrogenase
MASIVEPVGPVAAISGWNAPAITPCRKVGGALAAGCSVVLKPSESTPACALIIAEALQEAGLPAGVLNVVFGDPAAIGRRLATDTALRALTFTGSTQIGKQLASYASATLKKLVLELGGHAPALVFDGVDVASVAQAVVAAKYRNSGQVCTSPTRIWVQAKIYEEFVTCFTQALLRLKVDDPFDPSSSMGPLQNLRRVESVQALVTDATKSGGRAIEGSAPTGRGFWHPATALVDVPAGARVMQEEPFGPIAILGRFGSVDQAVAEANRLPFGLAAYAFTRDLAVAERLARDVQTGTLAVNHLAASFPETPFGG